MYVEKKKKKKKELRKEKNIENNIKHLQWRKLIKNTPIGQTRSSQWSWSW